MHKDNIGKDDKTKKEGNYNMFKECFPKELKKIIYNSIAMYF